MLKLEERIMRKLNLLFAAFALVACFSSAPVRADLITIKISGYVTSVSDQYNHFGGQITAGTQITGTPITGTYTYDSAISGLGSYQYSASPAGISVTVGDFNFQTNPANVDFSLGVENGYLALPDYYGLISRRNLPLSNGTSVQFISWQLYDPTGTALSSDAFPLTAPDLNKWASNSLNITHDRDFGIQATITSAVLVPEPATAFLFGLGLMLIRKRFSK